jgi:hypothetical protein
MERIAEWGAPALLAAATGWAASKVGLSLTAILAASMFAAAVGILAMRKAGNATPVADSAFEPVELELVEDEDVLLLEDRLSDPEPDSRVVQLFARQDPTPGELVLRISDYLGGGESGSHRAPAPESPAAEQRHPDATGALHAALANIRASLR